MAKIESSGGDTYIVVLEQCSSIELVVSAMLQVVARLRPSRRWYMNHRSTCRIRREAEVISIEIDVTHSRDV